jgi:uncharacterized protein YcbK (DUF882 family)
MLKPIFAEFSAVHFRKAIQSTLCISLAILTVLVLPGWTVTSVGDSGREYRLRLYHTHTNERIDIVYRRGENYVPSAVDRLDEFLRDHRTGDVHALDPHLFDILHDLAVAVGKPESEIDIVCGYRTPWSNEFLRRTTVGVAAHSLHMEGEAIDIRIPGVNTLALRNAAVTLHRGGVGYYPESKFVHVDVGPVRWW